MLKKLMSVVIIGSMILTLAGCTQGAKTALNQIKEEKEMSFAMTGQYPPFNFIGEEDGEVQGFDIDIAKAIADKLGVEAKPITTAWDGIIEGLKGKRFDMIIGSMGITAEREEQVNFTDPYYLDGAQLFVKKGSDIKSIDDIGDGTIGVVTGTTYHEYLVGLDNIDASQVKQFESDVDNIKAVENGRIDAMVTGRFVGLEGAKMYEADIVMAGDLLYEERCAIAIRKGDEELVEAVNKALEEIRADGTYAEISKKWFGVDISK